jgi:predicted O-methyltransferase YrrM
MTNPNTIKAPEGWHPAEMMRHLTELVYGLDTVVEVGSWLGHSALALAQGCAGRVYCVDHWRGSHGCGAVDDPLDLYMRFLDHVHSNVSGWRVVPLYGESVTVARLFKVSAVDLVYIDGEHSYDAVTADLLAWVPKVKAGGIVCGDDYGEVKGAVQDFFKTQPVASVDLLASQRLWVARLP